MKEYLELFITFFKIGLFTYGGGYAMLPLISKEVVENKKWASEDEIIDYFGLSQCTPGVIAVNIATIIGNKIKGIIGGIIATLGVVCPSIIVITIIASFLDNFLDYEIVRYALNGVSIAVCALMTKTIYKMAKRSLTGILAIIICLFAFVLSRYLNLSSIYIVLSAGIFGFIFGGKKNAS